MASLRAVLPVAIVLWIAWTVPTAQSQAVVFAHVNLISMDAPATAAVRADVLVLIQNGLVSGVGGSGLEAKIPAGALRIDGRGKFLMPALAEMHAHIPNDAAESNVEPPGSTVTVCLPALIRFGSSSPS